MIAFLGYDPHPEPKTLADHLQAKYRRLGLPRKEVSKLLGVDENTLKAYDDGVRRPGSRRNRSLIERFLSDS